MAKKTIIQHQVGHDLYSITVFPKNYFTEFSISPIFEKRAAIEVFLIKDIPAGMEEYTIQDGLYAVFEYKGNGNDSAVFQYIHNTWLPHSNYALDDRPHFEILGEKYKNNDPASEEQIWIPIKSRGHR